MVKVKLLAYSVPTVFTDKGALTKVEKIASYAARMTITNTPLDNLKESIENNTSKAKKSLLSVMEQGHTSVIEHIYFTFEITEFSRIISQQLTRHRIASFTQRGQRYVKTKSSYITPPSIKGNKEAFNIFREGISQAFKAYNQLIAIGIPREDARFVLPNAVSTSLIMTMNARELLHFLELRLCANAQWEIRELAFKILELVYPLAPTIFEMAGPACISRGQCPEKKRDITSCRYVIKKLLNMKSKNTNHA